MGLCLDPRGPGLRGDLLNGVHVDKTDMITLLICECSMTRALRLAPYVGFTEDEVKGLCESHGRDFDEIKAYYAGYEISDPVPAGTQENPRYSIYAPRSMVGVIPMHMSMSLRIAIQ